MVTGRFEVNLALERKREGCDKKNKESETVRSYKSVRE